MWPTTMLMVWNLWSPGPVWLVMEDDGVHVSFSEMLFSVSMLFGCSLYIYMLDMFIFCWGLFFKEDGTLK